MLCGIRHLDIGRVAVPSQERYLVETMPVPKSTRAANLSRGNWILRRLSDVGHRLTDQRAIVVRTIADRPGAFTAEALVDDLRPRGIGRATVYRALELLEREGMLTKMHLGSCHGYTVCDEGHHHHLVCTSCNAVVPLDASGIEAEIQKLAQRLRFRVDTHTLEFAGLCERCQATSLGDPPLNHVAVAS
jgi:Fur family transcriptional regulator, ferric uptake regulator